MDRIIKQDGVEYSYDPIDPVFDILLKELIATIKYRHELNQFGLVSISNFLWDMAKKYQYNIEVIKEWLIGFQDKYRKYVYYCATSTAFIDIRTSYPKRDHIIRRLYIYIPNKGYQSHIGIDRSLVKLLQGVNNG